MNFFKSVFADEELNQSSPLSNPRQSPSPEPEPEPEDEPTWGFVGGLIKTFATKSESVIETYRRDLQEFSTGLKMETQVFKDVASSSLEVGASKAQESLESVGQAFDSLGSAVWNSTAQIITQGSNLIDDSDLANSSSSSSSEVGALNTNAAGSNSPVGKYNRFEAQLRGIQTFVEEPEDVEDYSEWKEGFDLEDKRDEIEGLLKENGILDSIYEKVVPNLVDHEVFWCRYYYRVYKLEQAESVRAKLVERANEDEDLSWDVDDEDDKGNVEEDKDKGESMSNNNGVDKEEEIVKKVGLVDEKGVSEVSKDNDEKVGTVDEKAVSEVGKDSEISEASSLGWDEIEDVGSEDEDVKKGKQSEGPSNNREELRKPLNVAEYDEDLSWDIEDDDDPIKKS